MNKISKLIFSLFFFFTFGTVVFSTNIKPNKLIVENKQSNAIEKINPINYQYSFGIQKADARQIIYKISNLTNNDVNNYCNSRNWPEGTKVYGTDWGACTKDNGYKRINVKLEWVCEYKFPGYGTWLGDGGNSCYDSYHVWW